MNSLEDLMIYKQYLEMIYYTENITIKYPKNEKNNLVSYIKNKTYNGIELIIKAQKERDKNKRLLILNQIDTNLKMLKVLNLDYMVFLYYPKRNDRRFIIC